VLEELARSVEVPLTTIGEVTDGADVILLRDGEPVQDLSGWNHFR
jgi:thiamine monophosphate kinase